MPADPYTVVEEALAKLPLSLRHDVDVVNGTVIRALVAAGYLTGNDHDCAQHAIDSGQLEQVGHVRPDGAFVHPLMVNPASIDEFGLEPVYRLVTESETADG